MFISVDVHVHGGGARDQPPYTYLYLNKEFKSKSKWWWSVFARASPRTPTTYFDQWYALLFSVCARAHTLT